MKQIFDAFLQAGFYGSIMILLVILLRMLFRKLPRKSLCVLWLLVAVRLLIPLHVESVLSLQPSIPVEQPFSEYLASEEMPVKQPEYSVPAVTVPLPEQTGEEKAASPMDLWEILGIVWLSVMAVSACYCVISFLVLKQKVADAVRGEDGVLESKAIQGPFLLGYFKPIIYLPAGLQAVEREFVLAHERMHIRRGDNWWKLLGYISLSIHWYNPLVWLAYWLFCQDVETACDEQVIMDMNLQTRKAYSFALLNCGKRISGVLSSPVAFGEINLKKRIKNVLSYRKPGLWITIGSMLLAFSVALCFLTTPEKQQKPELQGQQLMETTAPTEVSAKPTESTATPTEGTATPTEGTTAPTEGTTAPTEGTTAPTEGTTAPTEGTTVPTEGTTAATEGTTVPTEGTAAPTEDTTAPTEKPTDSTEGTTEPTQEPAEGDVIAGGKWDGGPLTWKITTDGTLIFSGGRGIQEKSNGYIWKEYADVVRKIVLCDEIRRIPSGIFSGMYNVTSVQLGASVKEIGSSAFAGCASLSSITIPASVQKLGIGAFYGCTSLRSVTFAEGSLIAEIPQEAFSKTGLTVFNCPSHIKVIDFYAFSNCTSLHTVILQGGALEVHRGAFENCTALKRLVVGDSVDFYRSIDGCSALETVEFYSINSGTCKGKQMLTTAVLGGSCTVVWDGMFENCTSLSRVTFTGYISRIGSSAFENCVSLTGISLPYGVTEIASSAFKGSGLVSITIPETVQEISITAFAYSPLTQIVFTGNAPVIQGTSFTGVTATAYYPADNETWTEEVLKDYGGNITWVPVEKGE